jgi:hypothetical protein
VKSFVILVMWFGTMMGMFAQENIEAVAQREAAETKDVATRALETFQQIGKQDNFKSLGFESSDEMAGATLGEPVAVLMVELEDLRGYQAGSDPNKLLKPINKVIYPVSVKERVRSSIVLQKGKEGWKASDFGGGNFARLVATAREQSAKTTNLPVNAFFVVQVPALNAYFLGFREQGKLKLSSLVDDPTLKLSAGAARPAEEVFGELTSFARKYNGLPM